MVPVSNPDSTITEFSTDSDRFSPRKQRTYDNLELQMIREVNFEKGFDSWRFQFQLADIMKSADSRIEFKTTTNVGDGFNRSTSYTWCLRYDLQPSQPQTTGFEKYWFGLEVMDELKRPFPVLYRMVIWDETEGKVCFDWGQLVIFRPSMSQVMWNVIDEENPAQMALLKMESKNQFYLHVFIDIPISVCLGPMASEVDFVEPRFTLDTETDKLTHKFANIFEQVVIGRQQSEECEDEEDDLANFDADHADFMPASDIAIKVIDPSTKTERVFNCHRMILPLRSTYFNDLLHRLRRSTRSSSVSEEVVDKAAVIQIDNVDADIMEIILRYLYTGCMTRMSKHDGGGFDLATVIKITDAVYKFGLDDWKPYCQSVLLFDFVDDQSRREQLDPAIKLHLQSVVVVCMEQLSLAAYISLTNGNTDQFPTACVQTAMHKTWKCKGGTILDKEKESPWQIGSGRLHVCSSRRINAIRTPPMSVFYDIIFVMMIIGLIFDFFSFF